MISDMNLFLDEAKAIEVSGQQLSGGSVTLQFRTTKTRHDVDFNFEHERHEVTLFLTREQLIDIVNQINEKIPAVFRNEQCGLCAGTGTMAVSDGQTSWSGDDPCPTCDPINHAKLYPVN